MGPYATLRRPEKRTLSTLSDTSGMAT
jgi:hypothetical protein